MANDNKQTPAPGGSIAATQEIPARVNPPAGATYILSIPTRNGIFWGVVVIVGFLVAARLLYWQLDKGWDVYLLKIADTLIQGAVVGIGFAILKGIIEAITIRPN